MCQGADQCRRNGPNELGHINQHVLHLCDVKDKAERGMVNVRWSRGKGGGARFCSMAYRIVFRGSLAIFFTDFAAFVAAFLTCLPACFIVHLDPFCIPFYSFGGRLERSGARVLPRCRRASSEGIWPSGAFGEAPPAPTACPLMRHA
jgi:hypothetical protein